MCTILVSCNLETSKKRFYIITDGMNMGCQYDVILKRAKLIPSCVRNIDWEHLWL